MTDLQALKTPSLVLDLERVKGNAQRIGQRVSDFGAKLRPHVKTHKCVEVARIQTANHSGAITVSTLAEARAFAAHGLTDITYAVPIEPGKFETAIELSRNCERLALITDDPSIPAQLDEAARRAGVALDLFLKVDCGYHRCGVEPDTPEAFEIPRRIVDSSNLRFAGILTHAGHSYHCRSREELLAVAQSERDIMLDFADELRAAGVPVPTISIGSTPTITTVDHLKGIDEARPGNYIFFDAFQATLGSCALEDCALTVLAAVVHRDRTRRKVVIDAGAIALSKDRGAVEFDPACGYGLVLDLEGNDLGLRVNALSQEHGEITEVDEQNLDRLHTGARVRVLANHSCLTAAQHSHYHVLEQDRIVDRWEIRRGW
jgi:D-serine deaminase-like pyridoxal phosphate-dependent protein